MQPDLRWYLCAAVLLAACGPGPAGDDAGASGGTSSTGDAVTEGTSTTDEAPTTGSTGTPWEEVPDCEGLELAGDPADLAQTPRPDRDAEVLALSVEPSAAVAPQTRYELVRADLEAIRAIDPPLADAHVASIDCNALELWFWSYPPALASVWAGEYRAWDCLNEHYESRYPQPIDGIAFALYFDGVYGEAVRDAYAALPGFEEAEVLFSCEFAGSIALTPTVDAEGELVNREYRFESKDGVVRVYRVVSGEAPVLVG